MGWAPYQVVLRLFQIAEDRWPEIDAAYPSINLIKLPTHRFLNFVYAWAVAHIPPDKIEDFLFQLTAPLPGREKAKPTPSDADEDARLFMAAMQGLKG